MSFTTRFLWPWLGAVIALALSAGAPDRSWEVGNPFIRNYAQKEYGGEYQNWSITQDGRGVIYVGNNQGVLEFDGVRWRLIRTPRRNVVRSLGVDGQGRVYVGAVGEIGYLEPGPDGETRYVPLEGLLGEADRHFTDVWDTAASPQGMLFQTRERLLLFANGRFQIIPASTSFHVAFVVGGRTFVRQRSLGLMELREGRLTLLPGGERFKQESVFAMLPLPGQDILVASRKIGFWRLTPAGLVPVPTPADPFFKRASLYSGTQLADGTLALATINGGIALLDGQGRLVRVLDRSSGLQGDNVKFMHVDRQGSLWLALDNGISRVDWPAPCTLFDERMGLSGTVWSMFRHQGTLVAVTGMGVFTLGQAGAGPGFHQVPGLAVQSNEILSVDGALLLGTGAGVFELRRERLLPIRPSSNNAISLLQSVTDPGRVFAGLQGGLASIHRSPEGWVDEGAIPGVDLDIYSMAEDPDHRLWLGTAAQGLLRLTFAQGWRGGASSPAPKIEPFTTAQGLPSNAAPKVYLLDGQVRFATHGGLCLFNEATGRIQPDLRFQALFPAGPRWIKDLRVDGQHRVWLVTVDEATGLNETGMAIPQGDGSYRWDPAPFKRFSEFTVESLLIEPDGTAWFGGPQGALRFDSKRPARPAQAVLPILRRVTARGLGPVCAGQVLPYSANVLRFEFAIPAFQLETGNAYQVRLVGYDRDWSPWTLEAQKEYTNLPEGSYRFQVRARDGFGAQAEVSAFGFRIRPPWYRTWWAFLAYLGLGGGLILAGVRVRVRLLEEGNRELQHQVALATEDLREREQMLATQAGTLAMLNGDLQALNDRLHELNDQKDRLLGIVIHDLRNPLNVMLLSAQLIREETELEQARLRAGIISGQAVEMGLLIDRFLDIAALDSGKIQAQPETFPLIELLMEVAERHGGRAREKGILLRLEPSEDLGLTHADPRFLRSVLDNLVSNALKFTPTGRTVTLALARRPGQVLASVADQGPGLTQADRTKLFGRFSKLSARPTAGEKSVGLGLSIAKEMVEAAGGSIWVDSEPGQGATFWVALPAQPEP